MGGARVCVCVCVCADCVRCAPRPANKTKNPSHQAQFCFQLLISITVRIRVIFNVGVSILWLGCMHPAPVAYPTPYTAPPYHRVLCVYIGAALQQLLHSLQVPSLCRIHQRCVRHCKFCFEAAITPRVSNSACLCDEGRDNLRTLRVRGWSGLEK